MSMLLIVTKVVISANNLNFELHFFYIVETMYFIKKVYNFISYHCRNKICGNPFLLRDCPSPQVRMQLNEDHIFSYETFKISKTNCTDKNK